MYLSIEMGYFEIETELQTDLFSKQTYIEKCIFINENCSDFNQLSTTHKI